MTDHCGAFECWCARAPGDPASRAAWNDHVRACTSCREQETADRALRVAFAACPHRPLSPFFAKRCASHAPFGPRARPLGRRERTILRAYWVVALIGAGLIVAWVGRPASIPPAAVTAMGIAALVVGTPVVLLAWLRGGLFRFARRVLG